MEARAGTDGKFWMACTLPGTFWITAVPAGKMAGDPETDGLKDLTHCALPVLKWETAGSRRYWI